MVTYELISRSASVLTYHYWPEDKRSYRPGTIIVDLDGETASLSEPAEKDFLDRTTGAEMNSMYMTNMDAMICKVFERAMRGDLKAVNFIMRYMGNGR